MSEVIWRGYNRCWDEIHILNALYFVSKNHFCVKAIVAIFVKVLDFLEILQNLVLTLKFHNEEFVLKQSMFEWIWPLTSTKIIGFSNSWESHMPHMRSAVIAILEVSCLHRRAPMSHIHHTHTPHAYTHPHTDMYGQMTKQVCEKEVTTQNIREGK